MAGGKHGLTWLEATLDAPAMAGSTAFRSQGKPYSIGPVMMDASPLEQKAVRAYVDALPHPIPMLEALHEITVVQGQVAAFRHPNGAEPGAGQSWVIWALADTGNATVEIPMRRPQARVVPWTEDLKR